jgi:O-antigen/teichoic acid export membrane protein
MRTVRGVAVTAAFLVLIDGIVLLQGLIVTRLLGPDTIGLYGIVSITVMSLIALKRVGIDEAYVQQESGAEGEFQRAFTLELGLSSAFGLAICIAAPILAAVYGESELLPLTLATAYLPIAFALQAPMWIFFRRMDYVRQRSLQAIVPLVTFAVTVPLAAVGVGVWSLVIGAAAGNAVGAVAAIAASPFRLALRYDREAARRYLAFSGPVFVSAGALLAVQQGQILSFGVVKGLAGAGFITLAVTLTRYVDRADQIVTAALYPAVCAVQGRTARLTELFEKSNRVTMMWTLPYAIALVLFAPDLVTFVLGHKWEPATILIQGLAGAMGLTQIGFNWFSFFRAHGWTRPPAWEGVVSVAAFGALAVPGLLVWGSGGFVGGRIAAVALTLGVRARFLRRLLPGVRLVPLVMRAARPVALAAAAALALRGITWGGHRGAVEAAFEVGLFAVVYAVAVLRLERPLIHEVRTTWRSPAMATAQAAPRPSCSPPRAASRTTSPPGRSCSTPRMPPATPAWCGWPARASSPCAPSASRPAESPCASLRSALLMTTPGLRPVVTAPLRSAPMRASARAPGAGPRPGRGRRRRHARGGARPAGPGRPAAACRRSTAGRWGGGPTRSRTRPRGSRARGPGPGPRRRSSSRPAGSGRTPPRRARRATA